VRGRPLIELPAEIELVPADGGGMLHVVDISLGGVGVWAQGREPFQPGQRVRVLLKLGRGRAVEIGAEVRYTRGPDRSFCGLAFDDADPVDRSSIRRYVAELVERGSVV
jgi:c-di-GMP-binding flagellar brake protein YcgR